MTHDDRDAGSASSSASKRSKKPFGSKRSERPRADKPRPAPKPRDGSELALATRAEAAKAFFGHAGRLVAIKDWSQSGLAKRLAERFRSAPEAADLALEAAARMAALGAIDDKRFSRGFLRSRLGKRSLSTALRELARHGVDKDTAEAAVDELRDEGLVADPADQAYAVWSKKFNHCPVDDKERAKQSRFMASRGFSYSALAKVWSRAKSEAEDRGGE